MGEMFRALRTGVGFGFPHEFDELAGTAAYAEAQRDLQAAALGDLLESTLP